MFCFNHSWHFLNNFFLSHIMKFFFSFILLACKLYLAEYCVQMYRNLTEREKKFHSSRARLGFFFIYIRNAIGVNHWLINVQIVIKINQSSYQSYRNIICQMVYVILHAPSIIIRWEWKMMCSRWFVQHSFDLFNK